VKKSPKTRIEDIYLEKALAQARSSILPFTIWTFKGKFQVNWHHRVLGRKLDLFIERKIPNLMVFLPPRCGKSEMISRRAPALIFGKNPRARIIATSYSASLAGEMNRDVQFTIDSPEYRQLFPEVLLPGDGMKDEQTGTTYTRNSEGFDIFKYRGSYRCAGVGGGIVGKGGDYIFIDDPIKNPEEAESESYRKHLKDWYRGALYSRREKGAGICLVMQRWHDDDLAGWLEKEMKESDDAEQWDIVRFPMLSEETPIPGDPRKEPGIPLWPEKFDEAECRKIRRTQGSRNWLALYQQRPLGEKGNEIQKGWLKTWLPKDLPAFLDIVILSVDAAFKATDSSSFVAVQAWGKKGPNFFLLDQDRRRMGFIDTVKAIQDMRTKWPRTTAIVVEDKANGPAIIETLKEKISGIIPCMPYGSKLARLRAVSPLIEAGNVLIPSPETHHWVPAYESELLKFPNSADNDQVDTTSQALQYLKDNGGDFAAFVTI